MIDRYQLASKADEFEYLDDEILEIKRSWGDLSFAKAMHAAFGEDTSLETQEIRLITARARIWLRDLALHPPCVPSKAAAKAEQVELAAHRILNALDADVLAQGDFPLGFEEEKKLFELLVKAKRTAADVVEQVAAGEPHTVLNLNQVRRRLIWDMMNNTLASSDRLPDRSATGETATLVTATVNPALIFANEHFPQKFALLRKGHEVKYEAELWWDSLPNMPADQ